MRDADLCVTSAPSAAIPALARSFWRYRHGVSSDINDCGVGITPQMCNRVTNHGDTGTFSKPRAKDSSSSERD